MFKSGKWLLIIVKFCDKLKNRLVSIVLIGFYLLKIIVVKEIKFGFNIVVVVKLIEIDWVYIVFFILLRKFEIKILE